MERKEIIENLKKNERAFMFLPMEEQDFIIDRPCLWLNGSEWEFGDNCMGHADQVYRLPENYTEELPEYEVCEVAESIWGEFIVKKEMTVTFYEKLQSYPRFAGVQFKDQRYPGIWYMSLNKFIDADGHLWDDTSYKINENGWLIGVKPAVPVKARFLKEG